VPRHALVLNSSHDLFIEKGRDLNIERKKWTHLRYHPRLYE